MRVALGWYGCEGGGDLVEDRDRYEPARVLDGAESAQTLSSEGGWVRHARLGSGGTCLDNHVIPLRAYIEDRVGFTDRPPKHMVIGMRKGYATRTVHWYLNMVISV